MYLQSGPDPDAISAIRTLPGGRRLAVFRRVPELVTIRAKTYVGVTSDGTPVISPPVVETIRDVTFMLAISDGTTEPVIWETVPGHADLGCEKDALACFAQFDVESLP